MARITSYNVCYTKLLRDYATLSARALELAADNAWNEGAVLGAPVAGWRSLDLPAIRGTAFINGVAVGEGRGADSMGHPLVALQCVITSYSIHYTKLYEDLTSSWPVSSSRFS